jgi:hypothetical protein
MVTKKVLSNLTLVIFIVFLMGCSGNPTPNSKTTIPIPTTANVAAVEIEKIKFKTAGGSDLFSLKQQSDGAKLVDGNNQELVKIKVDHPGKIKFKNPADQILGYVVTNKGYWQLKSQNGNQDLYIFRHQDNGNYVLEDGTKKEIYQVQSGNDKLEIKNPNQQLVYQVKIKQDKTSLINPLKTTVFYTKGKISPIAFACFGLDSLTREQQAALAYAVNLTGGI